MLLMADNWILYCVLGAISGGPIVIGLLAYVLRSNGYSSPEPSSYHRAGVANGLSDSHRTPDWIMGSILAKMGWAICLLWICLVFGFVAPAPPMERLITSPLTLVFFANGCVSAGSIFRMLA